MVKIKPRELDVRAQVSMVFHLDKCIGCHTCSLACKNVWTDRPGAEYMWWNNVETKPGTGYPTRWEDQETWRGGWQTGAGNEGGRLRLRSQGRTGGLLKLFYNPRQPGLEDYYEPWTYRYSDLFDAPAGADQPTAVPVSQLTGAPIAIESGPNWDDDLSGSPLYAENDPSLAALHPEERRALFDVERLVMAYLPRICNHCLNPSCVASCPSGALYKRGEDGIVLVDQERCRGWRACVVACPYKKTYYNWRTGKSEKCILCYPRLEAGEPPACFHACVGRIRYLGVLLYDAAGIREAATAQDLVAAQRALLLDPRDPEVVEAARRAGVGDALLDTARRSPVWRFVKEWELALPLHPEFRTVPMLYYVPPLLPVVGRSEGELYRRDRNGENGDDLFAGIEEARLPIRYLARLFAAGNEEPVRAALRRLVAVRFHRRARELPSVGAERVAQALAGAGLTSEAADEIYRLTALSTLAERYVVPPLAREQALGDDEPDAAESRRQSSGFGVTSAPRRGA